MCSLGNNFFLSEFVCCYVIAASHNILVSLDPNTVIQNNKMIEIYIQPGELAFSCNPSYLGGY